MLTADDLTKLATQPVGQPQEDPRTPIRKAYDAITQGAQTAGGAVVAGIAGLNSLDNKGPVKTI